MALTQQQRIELGLDDPPPIAGSPPATLTGEFIPVAAPIGVPDAQQANPNLRLLVNPEAGGKVTGPKLRMVVNELLAGNVEQVDKALKALLATNPRVGVELYLELAQLSLPKLRAVAMQVDDRTSGDANPRTLTFQQLQAALLG